MNFYEKNNSYPIIDDIKNNISYSNNEIVQAMCGWIDSVCSSGKAMSKETIRIFEEKLDKKRSNYKIKHQSKIFIIYYDLFLKFLCIFYKREKQRIVLLRRYLHVYKFRQCREYRRRVLLL